MQGGEIAPAGKSDIDDWQFAMRALRRIALVTALAGAAVILPLVVKGRLSAIWVLTELMPAMLLLLAWRWSRSSPANWRGLAVPREQLERSLTLMTVIAVALSLLTSAFLVLR